MTLVRLGEDRFAELQQAFTNVDLLGAAGFRKPPADKSLRSDLFDDETIVVWEMVDEHEKAVGYAVYIACNGPPFVFLHFASGKVDLDVAQDAMLSLVHAFFAYTKEQALYTFLPKPIDEEANRLLIEGGFDLVEDYPVDPEHEAAYVIERHTYKAYYAEDDEDAEEELNFDEE